MFSFLCEELPDVFKSESFISNPEGYERQNRIITLITSFIALLGLSYLSLLLDNKRMEFIAKKTEGRYTLCEGMSLYIDSFIFSDVISAILPPLIIAIPVYFVPERWLDYGLRFPMYTSLEMCNAFGFWEGVILLSAVSICARLLAAPIALLRWRAAWLSGTAEVI